VSLADIELCDRQLQELANLGYTGQLVVHMHQGRIRRITIEGAVLVDGGEQRLHLVPAVGYNKGGGREGSGIPGQAARAKEAVR